MRRILGVDGGNTKTIALIADEEGNIVGTGRSGCSDIYGASSPAAAIEQLHLAIQSALTQAGIEAEHIYASCFSLAGADWPEDYALLKASIHQFGFRENMGLFNDAIGALRAGSPDGTGVIIACGTGVATAARHANGDFWHTSFWQESMGGIEFGRQTIRAVVRSSLGIEPPTSLTEPVLAHFQQPHVEGLLRLFTERDIAHPTTVEVSRLAPILLQQAESGDAVALQIVLQNGRLMADYALVAARKVGLEGQPFTLVLNGGVFRHSGQVLVDAITSRILMHHPGINILRGKYEPAVGALLLSYECGGMSVTPQIIAHLEDSLPPPALFKT